MVTSGKIPAFAEPVEVEEVRELVREEVGRVEGERRGKMEGRPWRIMLKNCPIMLCSNAFIMLLRIVNYASHESNYASLLLFMTKGCLVAEL